MDMVSENYTNALATPAREEQAPKRVQRISIEIRLPENTDWNDIFSLFNGVKEFAELKQGTIDQLQCRNSEYYGY